MPFQLVEDASELAPLVVEEKYFILPMVPYLTVGRRIHAVGLSGLFRKGSGGEFFRRLVQHEDLVKEGEDPTTNLLKGIIHPEQAQLPEKHDKHLEATRRNAERDAQIFGKEGHRLSVETMQELTDLPAAVSRLLVARGKIDEPYLPHERLAELNESMQHIMNDPNISHCPELLEFAQVLYTIGVAPEHIVFDPAAERIGAKLRMKDISLSDIGMATGRGGTARSS